MKKRLDVVALILSIAALLLVLNDNHNQKEYVELQKENLRLSIQLKRMQIPEEPPVAEFNLIEWFQRMDSVVVKNPKP